MEPGTEITNLVGSVGFPIVACGALFWMINTTMKELSMVIQELSDSIREMTYGSKSETKEVE